MYICMCVYMLSLVENPKISRCVLFHENFSDSKTQENTSMSKS